MAHFPASEIPSTTHHIEQFIRPEILMAELPQDGNRSRRYENNPLLYSDATYNVRDFISQKDNESLDKSYENDSPNEICSFKLDQAKIDELANDYRAETCVSSSHESAIQKESCKETIKSDSIPSRNEKESRCKSNRKRKTRRKMPEGVIIDLSNDVYGISRGGIKISVSSMHNLVPEMKFVAVPKKQYSTWNPRNKVMKKMTDNSLLTVLCVGIRSKMKKTRRSTKRKCKNYSRESMNNILRANTTVNASKKLKNILNGRRELHVENNMQSLCTPHKILDSTQCCHHDDMLIDIDNAQYPILNTEQTCVDRRKHIANYYCSIFNDKRQEYHICDREDYNTDGSDFNAEMQADWTAKCFHPEYTRAKGCRCFYDSSECNPDINMQRGRCPLMSQTARLFENSALPMKHQREEIEQFGSDELQTDIAPEFATEANEYSSDGVEQCTNCDGKKRSSASTIRKRVASKASVLAEPGGSIADLRDSRSTDASRCEIDTRSGKRGWTTTMVERDGDRSYKSDSLKAVDTWDMRAWRDNCIGRRCADRVVTESSRSDQDPGEKGGFARGVDSKWKRGSIETDAQQLDYKWKRRIATVDAGTRARVDFKGKRDSRYKSEEAIHVQLRESAKIRKRESLKMVEATSQTRSDDINVDGKRRETRDYSPWTSLQMGKIWSQVHDACKNVVKLAATSVSRVVKDAPKSEGSQRNPVEVADARLVESSSSCAGKICGETCRKNLMRLKSGEKTVARQERAIGDVGKYRGDTEAPMRKNSRIIAPSRHDMRKHAYQNAEKEEGEESCVNYSEYERDRYRDTVEFPPRNETCSHDEDVHSQFHLSESFTYLENSTYPKLRSRGGSDNRDDNRDFARSIVDKKSVQRIYEKARSIGRHESSISKKCVCYDRTQETRMLCTDRSSQHVACYELSVTTDREAIRANVPVASRNNPLYHESQSTNVSSPEDNRRVETPATPEQTRSREEMENTEDTISAETERSFTSAIAAVAAVSSTEANPTVHSSRNDPNEPIASTSKWKTSPVLPRKSQKNCPRLPFCATAMKFWRKRSSTNNKTTTPVLKWSRRSIGRKELPSTAATTYDSGVKITQIEPSTVQTAREGNKNRAYVNVQVQTPDAIVTKILSEFLLSGEKKRRVLMSIILQSESDPDRREAETQTSSNDVTSGRIDMFNYPDKYPQSATTSKTVQCFVCDKQDCYEIRHSDNSITLEEALITEYSETSELNDYYLAERKADIKIPP